MDAIGFIILRHVNSKITDCYWKESYNRIKKFYPKSKILIIDDNSDYSYVDTAFESKIEDTTIVKSEYHGRGELLPYIYFLKYKHCDIACIIHDSVFINKTADLNTDTYSILWEFEHNWDQPNDEIILINSLDNNSELIKFYKNKELWKGCFGGMSVINYNFLKSLNDKYNFKNMIPFVKTRYNRMSFERVIASILQCNSPKKCLFGNIHKYCPWGIKMQNISMYEHLPFIKVWTGR
jgi:hypothetical protein